ncbi:MAG: polysaccharide biosynthesis C-terminal domain-containing protein, partial [Angelakisella sp.]
MSYFVTAYDIFTPIYSLVVTGLGIAVSRMVSEYAAKGNRAGVESVLRASRRIFLTLGFLGAGILLAAAPAFVHIINNSAALFAVLAIVPAVIFSCISSSYRGYYQGLSNMLPTAMSQVIESVTRMLLGILLAYGITVVMLAKYTSSGHLMGYTFENESYARLFIMRFAAAGAILGVTISTAIGAMYIRLRFAREHKTPVAPLPAQQHRETGKRLIAIAIPIALSTLVVNLSALIDLVSVMNCLHTAIQKGGEVILSMYPKGIPAEVSLELLPEYLYGSYSGLAYSVFNLIPAITAALGVSAIPAVSRAWAKEDRRELEGTVSSILKVTMLIALPAGLGISVLAEPILLFLYPARVMEVSIVAPILRVMGLSAVLVAAATPVNSILQAIGKERLPLFILLLGAAIKLVTNFTLISRPEINIQGVPYGTLLCYAVILTLSSAALRLSTGIHLSFYRIFIKPLFCAIGSSTAALSVYRLLAGRNSLKLMAAIACAGIV